MKKKRGFKLKSGNNIGAKGKKPSNFKMMGASPAKAMGRYEYDVDEMGETVPGSGRRISDEEAKTSKRVLTTGQSTIDDAKALAEKLDPSTYNSYAEYEAAKKDIMEGAKKSAKIGLKSDILPDIERNLTMSEDKRRQDIKNVEGDEYDAKEQERIRVKRILGYVPNRLK